MRDKLVSVVAREIRTAVLDMRNMMDRKSIERTHVRVRSDTFEYCEFPVMMIVRNRLPRFNV